MIDIGFDGFICACGSYILLNRDVLFYKKLEPSLCADTVELVRKCRMNAKYESMDGVYFDIPYPTNDNLSDELGLMQSHGFDTDRSLGSPGFTFDKFNVWIREDCDLTLFEETAAANFDFIYREHQMIEVVPKGLSKATGMDIVLNHFGADKTDTFAFGDGYNDLPMLLYAQTSILMGNGERDLDDQVSFVTKDISDDGVEFALKHFELI